MPPRPKLPEDELEEVYLKGSGPGGQKIVCRRPPLPSATLIPFRHTPFHLFSLLLAPHVPSPVSQYLTHSSPHPQLLTVFPLSQNKTNSAVQLRHIPTNIVIKCQETRSRTQNRKLAREILAAKVDFHLNGDKSRVAIVGNVKKKKADSKAKKARRKYKKLEEEKAGKGGAGVDGQIVEGEEGREVEEGEEGEEWEEVDAEAAEGEEEVQEAKKGEEAEKRGGSADAAVKQ